MDPDLVSTMQQRIVASISRSAVMVLSTSLSRRLRPYFSASELILVLLALHTILNATRTVPGFNASWRTLRDLMQFLLVQALASYISSGSDVPQQNDNNPSDPTNHSYQHNHNHYTTMLNLALVLVTLECIPAAKGWVGDDLDSFTTSVSYIFSDRISAVLSELNIPLFGATIALCIGGKGLLGRTLAFVGINTLSALAFEAISGGELSLAWPITLLYFVHEMSARYDVDAFFNFGLLRASDVIFASLSARGLPAATVFMAFLFLASLFPADPVWAGICVLVFVQAGSDWFLRQLGLISATDPVLAGLCLVTAVHFISIAVEHARR